MSEDTTKDLPNESEKTPTTQPMLKEILEELRSGFVEMRREFAEVKEHLRKVDRRLAVLSDR